MSSLLSVYLFLEQKKKLIFGCKYQGRVQIVTVSREELIYGFFYYVFTCVTKGERADSPSIQVELLR
jgi:hypothetical protein